MIKIRINTSCEEEEEEGCEGEELMSGSVRISHDHLSLENIFDY